MTRPLVLRTSRFLLGSVKLRVSELTPDGALQSLHTVNLTGLSPRLGDVVESELENGRHQFVIQPEWMDGSMLRELVRCWVKVTERGGQMIVLAPSPKAREFFKLMALDQVLTFCSSLPDALNVLRISTPSFASKIEGPISPD